MHEHSQIFTIFVTAIMLLVSFHSHAENDLSEVRKEQIVAAIPENFPPYYLIDSSGKPGGYAVETMSKLAARSGFQIRYVIKPDWDTTMKALSEGEVDLIPNLGITPERSKIFDFTVPLETLGLGVFVSSNNNEIQSMEDLDGKSVAVVIRNAAVKWLANYPQVEQRMYEHQEQALFALLSGDVDALIYPINVMWKMASNIGADARIRQAGLPVLEVKRAVAVRKGNQVLLERLDHAVRELLNSEQYGDAYAQRRAKPQHYWTLERLWMYGGVVMFGLLPIIFWWWRRYSIAKLESQLQQNREKLERAEAKIAILRERLGKGDA